MNDFLFFSHDNYFLKCYFDIWNNQNHKKLEELSTNDFAFVDINAHIKYQEDQLQEYLASIFIKENPSIYAPVISNWVKNDTLIIYWIGHVEATKVFGIDVLKITKNKINKIKTVRYDSTKNLELFLDQTQKYSAKKLSESLYLDSDFYLYELFELRKTSIATQILHEIQNINNPFQNSHIDDMNGHTDLSKTKVEALKYQHSGLSNDRRKTLAKQIVDLMEVNQVFLKSELRISDVAVYNGTSINHISETINQVFNLNFNRFVNNYRIEYAKTLLTSTNKKTILEIALSSGFNSSSSFYNIFKSYTSFSPKKYRDIHLKMI